ncbi:YdcF family protein, partial [Muricomes intestini]
IVLEDTSRSTWENLQNSGKIIDKLSLPVGVVTNDFHMYRALQIGRKAGFTNIRGIVATSNPVLQLNYLVREFFAVIWMKKIG